MLTGVTAATTAASSAPPRTSEVIAHNKAQAAQKLHAASTASTSQQHQPQSALHSLAHRTKQLYNMSSNGHPPRNDGPPGPLISPSQLVPDDAMEDARAAAEAAARANALAQRQGAPLGQAAANNNNASVGPAHDVPPPPAPAATPLPSSFLGMTQTKQQQSDAIALYRSQQQALTDARTHLAEFVAKCNKRAPVISLPLSLRANYSSVRFTAVEGNAAFYKPMMDELKELAEESDKAAYALLLEGKQKYIAHLESLVKTQSFVSRAITTYTAFVASVNDAYAARSSATVVPVAIAVAKFESTLRKEIDIYDAQQVEAALKAQAKKREIVAMEIEAEESIVAGAHNGNNIAQIAVKATKVELAKTKKSLDDANRNISDLQEQVNRLLGATVDGRPKSEQTKLKRKESDRTPHKKAPSPDEDAMDDGPGPVPAKPSKPSSSNSRGGGRQQPSKKFKRDTGGKEDDGRVDVHPTSKKKQMHPKAQSAPSRSTVS